LNLNKKEGTLKFHCGDFFAIRSYGLRSCIIRLLSSIRYGIPFKKTFSHVETAVSGKRNISAQAKCVMYVDNNREGIQKSDVIVFRLKKFYKTDKENHVAAAAAHLETRYAYGRYILDAFRITLAVFILFGSIFFILGIPVLFLVFPDVFKTVLKTNFMAWVALLVLLFIGIEIAKIFDKSSEDCAENASLIYSKNKRWAPIPKERNEFPNGMVQVWRNLVLNGVAEVVAEKKRGRKWEFKSKQDQPKIHEMILQKMI